MSQSAERVYVARFESPSGLASQMQNAFSWLGDVPIKPDSRVFIKPNLTYPFHKPGVTTSPECMRALVETLRDTTDHITFVESDGGAYAWPALEAMKGHGLLDLCERYGVKTMNLTERPRRTVSCEIGGREVRIEVSAEMLDESDLFITMPVPKMHVMTYLTLGFKNQWGCVPDVKRLRHHPDFDHEILAVNKVLRTAVAVYDGTFFLNRTGPMDGDPVRKDLLIVSNSVGAGDLVCADLMRVTASKASHLRLAQQTGMMPCTLDEVTLNCDLETFYGEPFRLERTLINQITLVVFHSHFLTQIVYDSWAAKPIHEILYLVRGRPTDVSPRW